MRSFRKILFWAHLGTGVLVALVVLIMSVTGVALTYQRQVTAWADTRGMEAGPPQPGAQRLPPTELLRRVAESDAGRPTTVRWHADPERPAEVAIGRERTLFVNAYTGEVLGQGNAAVRRFFQVMVGWHRWLGVEGEGRPLARAITGAANLGFLFLVLSGLYLWWPANRTRRAFRNVLAFRRGLSPKARDFNWHNVVGFWSVVPLAIVVASGVMISYPWATNLVYRLAGDTPPQPVAARPAPAPTAASEAGPGPAPEPVDVWVALEGVDPAVRAALAYEPEWRTLLLQIPGRADGPIALTLDRSIGGQPQHQIRLENERSTGAVLRATTLADDTPGRRARSILRFAHTGEVLGFFGQTLAGLVTAGSILLVWTGLALSLRRLRSWAGRRKEGRRATTAVVAPEAVEAPVGTAAG